MSHTRIKFIDWGLIDYVTAWKRQEELRQKRIRKEIENTVIFCEHPAVYTVGRQDCDDDWISSPDEIKEAGIEVVKCNRGGRITYHGQGQLVVYFIVRVQDFAEGVKDFVRLMEDVSKDVLSAFSLKGETKKEYPGVWVGDKKIVAIGLHVMHGVSMHGLSLNVAPDMNHYKHIVPCGIKEFKVTSLGNELAIKTPDIDEVKKVVKNCFSWRTECLPAGKAGSNSADNIYMEKVRLASPSNSSS